MRMAALIITCLAAWILFWFGSAWLNLTIGVNLWYPPAGLTFAILLLVGIRALPLPIIASLIAGFSLWPWEHWPHYLFTNLTSPLGYALMAQLLRKGDHPTRAIRDLFSDSQRAVVFLATASLGALFSAGIWTLFILATDFPDDPSPWTETFLRWWLSEFIGAATIAPAILILGRPWIDRMHAGQPARSTSSSSGFRQPRSSHRSPLQMGFAGLLMLALLWAVPHIQQESLYPFMLLFLLPLQGWILAEQKLRVSVLILLLSELSIVAMAAIFGQKQLAFQYQLMMATMIASGLITAAISQARLTTVSRFRDYAEISNDLLWDLDAEGRLQAITGYLGGTRLPAQHGQGGRHWRSYLVSRQPVANLRHLRTALKTRQPFRQVVLRMRLYATHSPVWTVTSALPRFDEEGEFLGYRGTTTDITELKETEQALQRSRGELEQRVKQLARLASQLTLAEQRERRRLSKILHDHLQQLLVAILLGLEQVTKGTERERRERVTHVKSLLDQSLTATKTLAVQLSPPFPRDTDLADMLIWLTRMMKKNHGLTTRLVLDERVSPNREDVRAVLFESVREALFNIVKHAQVNEAEIMLNKIDGNALSVTIRDRGVGIKPKNSEDNEWSSGGLGLVAMRERLSLLGGDTSIESSPGKGTRIRLSAPICPQSERPKTTSEGKGDRPTTLDKTRQDTPIIDRCLRILLVDDHVMLRQGLSSLLSDEPDLNIVGEASDGLEAIELAERLQPDLILMDYAMPRMNGLDATRTIHERWPEIRILALSMEADSEQAAKMLVVGASDYLCKSSRPAELLSRIRA